VSSLTPIPSGAGPPTVPAVGDVERLAAAWLLGYPAERTRRAYGRDLVWGLAFCGAYDTVRLRRVLSRPPAAPSLAATPPGQDLLCQGGRGYTKSELAETRSDPIARLRRGFAE